MIEDFWNGRGMGASEKRKHIRELMVEHGMDFTGIQETRVEALRLNWLEQLGCKQNFYWYILPSNGRSGDLLVGIKWDAVEVNEV
jgi:hypothetical protein